MSEYGDSLYNHAKREARREGTFVPSVKQIEHTITVTPTVGVFGGPGLMS